MEINGVITAGLHVFTVGESINLHKFGAPRPPNISFWMCTLCCTTSTSVCKSNKFTNCAEVCAFIYKLNKYSPLDFVYDLSDDPRTFTLVYNTYSKAAKRAQI